jgi:uncharacterized lipoprotein YddW (UPF0748 family)
MTTKKKSGCGCGSIPLSFILFGLGGSYWWLIYLGNIQQFTKLLPSLPLPAAIAKLLPPSLSPDRSISQPSAPLSLPTTATPTKLPNPANLSQTQTAQIPATPTAWDRKVIRGIYLSRYQITNNADEQTIRQRVRYYHTQGINTIIHGVWGNGCTMYDSQVMQQLVGAKSCPNQFQAKWLAWTIDEAHRQGMQVHAYFEKGIKIDRNSPIFDRAVANKWLVPGVDRTYDRVEHYVLDVEVPEVADLFPKMLAEFVTKYPTIDAVQWDDYLSYHAELPGNINRTASLTKFVRQMISAMKAANPKVSFDLCHHNPYWAKRYFAADWQQWGVDRVFIQDYNEKNFQQELDYAVHYAGVAITDNQLHRLPALIANDRIKGILFFPLAGKPQVTAAQVQKIVRDRPAASTPNAPNPLNNLSIDRLIW